MEKHILSKSTFIKGNQCLKALYLYKKRYFLRDRMPPERVATFTRGTRVGIFAQELFPGGIDCGTKSPRAYAKSIEKTSQAIAANKQVIYEAGFIKHNTLVFLDILVKKEDGWHAYEVKSSVKLSPTYYKDAALQNYVIKESGLDIKSFNLIHINPEYVFKNELNINALFNMVDVTKECDEIYDEIGRQIKSEIAILQEEHSPKVEIGRQCRTPYDCDFIGHCWKHIPKESIFSLPSITFDEKINIYKEYGTDMTKALNNEALPLHSKAQLNSLIHNEIIINHPTIKALNKEGEKKALFKIFMFRPAIPIFNNTQPYQAQVYGFVSSLMDKSGKTIDSKIYLSRNNKEMEQEVIGELMKYIEGYDQIFTYEENSTIDYISKNKNMCNPYMQII